MNKCIFKLNDICDISGGYAFKSTIFKDNGIPIIRIGDISDNKINISETTVYINENIEKYKNFIISKGDILIALSGATTGKFGIYNYDEPSLLNQRVAKLFPKKDVLNKYLYHYMNKLQDTIYNKALGCAQPNISPKEIGELEIYLPNINEQKAIVEVLDKSQKLMDKRKQQIEALDELVKSKFIEMFGDPVSNPKGWEKGKIADIIIKTQYGTSNKANEENGQFKILRMGNITYNGQFDFSDMKYIDLTEDEQKKYLVYKGEVLFNRTNSKELVGKTAVYKENEPMAYAGYLVKAIPNERATGEFIAAYMNTKYVKSKLLNMAKNIVGMANINAEEFKKIDIYIPPIELQNEYIKFIEQVDKLKFEMEKSLKELEDNFNSLMQRAFKGELFN